MLSSLKSLTGGGGLSLSGGGNSPSDAVGGVIGGVTNTFNPGMKITTSKILVIGVLSIAGFIVYKKVK